MKIEIFKNITIAYMRNVGEYGPENEQLMQDFKDYLKNNHLFNDNITILGIVMDNPAVTPADQLRYDVGLIINQNQDIDLDTRNIDDGNYAVFETVHTKEGVMDFWKNLPQMTEHLLVDYSKPIIERYAMDKVKNQLCEFCIPLKQF